MIREIMRNYTDKKTNQKYVNKNREGYEKSV